LRRTAAWLAWALIGGGARGVAAQSRGEGTAAFVAAATAAAARYRDPAAASADGYRPVGPDFPAMGQHWLNASLLVDPVLAPSRPQLLEYAEIEGTVTLVGVAYAALAQDQTPPSVFPVPAAVWHFHAGPVEEETFMPSHAGAGHAGQGPRVAVLHVWVGLENPDGRFASDNWALPYARRGLRAAPEAPRATARALALAASDGYLDELVRVVGRPDSVEAAGLAAIVRRARRDVLALLADSAGGRRAALDPVAQRRLAGAWEDLWLALRAAASPVVWARIAPYADR